jgi:hypothetical protein
MVYKRVTNAGFELRINMVGLPKDDHSDATRITVNLVDGLIKNAWVG